MGPTLTYDRGTIVLTDVAESDLDLGRVPGLVRDDRVGVLRGAASDHGRVASALARQGVTIEDRVLARTAPAPHPWRAPELRPYQESALSAWLAGGRRGVVALPTGAGKTRVALAALAATRASALCLVPTRVLLGQWLDVLRTVYGGPLGALGDGARRVEAVTVATFESAARHMPLLGDRFQALVVDEVHHFGRGTRDEALLMSAAPWRLGLSATPPSDAHQLARLAELVGPPVFALSVAALAGGFLAPFDVLTFRLRFTAEEAAAYRDDMARYRAVADPWFRTRRGAPARGPHADALRGSARHGEWEAFRRHAWSSAEGRAALAAWRRARALADFNVAKADVVGRLLAAHRDARTLVFTGGNAATFALAAGQLIRPITCDIGRAERSEALAAFAAGELRALVSAHVLDEGVDVPAADVAIVVGGSGQDREYVQRVGRLLRPAAGKRALVYHLVTRGTHEVARADRLQSALCAPGVQHDAASTPHDPPRELSAEARR